jgi:hypothetical protein
LRHFCFLDAVVVKLAEKVGGFGRRGVTLRGLERLRKNQEWTAKVKKTIPRRLKPARILLPYGTAEAVPFQSSEFFRSL